MATKFDTHRMEHDQANRFVRRFVDELRQPAAADALTELLIRSNSLAERKNAELGMALSVLRWLRRRMTFSNSIPAIEIEDKLADAGFDPEVLR